MFFQPHNLKFISNYCRPSAFTFFIAYLSTQFQAGGMTHADTFCCAGTIVDMPFPRLPRRNKCSFSAEQH